MSRLKLSTHALLVSMVLLVASSAQEEPRALEEQWGNLEGKCLFRTDPQEAGEREGWHRPDLREAGWRSLAVPGGWEEQGVTDPRPGRPPAPRGNLPWTDYDGVAWYRWRFVAPASWKDRELVLSLGSVDDQDRAWLNGNLVGETGSGVANPVTVWRRYRVPARFLKPGRENVLAVRVLDGGGPGGIMGPVLTLLPADLVEERVALPGADRPLAERFADPPAGARMLKIIHSWPDQPEGERDLLVSLAAQGFGGAVSNVSFTEYLESEERWRAFARAVEAARGVGMALWLYDERGYPSGTAGGLVLREHPEWQARGLLVAEASTQGERVALEIPPGELVLAAAFPVEGDRALPAGSVDLAPRVERGKISWAPPAGRWRVLAIAESPLHEGTHAAASLGDRIPYINLLDPAPTKRFLEVTHERYAAHLGQDLGRWFVATFTDEPSLMSLWLSPMPWRVLPWAPDLPAEFEKRRGRELLPLLPAIVLEMGEASRRARHEFWLTVGELVSERYFGQIQAWCREHGLASGGHLLAEESLISHVPLYGDLFRCARRMDAPGIDCLTSVPAEVPWRIARLAASAAELEGRTVTMCETSDFVQRYRAPGDARPVHVVSAEEIRGTCHRLLHGGIGTITSYHSFSGLSTAALRDLNTRIGRASTMLEGGTSAAEVAVLYPIESVWPRFAAAGGWGECPAAVPIEEAYDAATDALYAARRDFTIVDGAALASARVGDLALEHGALRWRVVVLPRADTLPFAAWENLARFRRAGGVVIALGALPANSETAFPDPRVEELAALMFGSTGGPRVEADEGGGAGVFVPGGWEALLPAVLDAVLERGVDVSGASSPVRATHRRVGGREVWFLINDGNEPWEGEVTVAAAGEGEAWDPASGGVSKVAGPRNRLRLEPHGATILRFARARPARRLPLSTGALPGLSLRALPDVAPMLTNGEFVAADLAPDAENASPGRPAWRAAGTLKKGAVDTFLFATFSYARPLDLEALSGLEVETWVPEGTSAPAQIVVILRDRDGADYLATSGLSLGVPGRGEAILPFSRFQLAGWSRDPDGRPDLDGVSAISVGWGGYYGQEGERLEFSLAAPRGVRW